MEIPTHEQFDAVVQQRRREQEEHDAAVARQKELQQRADDQKEIERILKKVSSALSIGEDTFRSHYINDRITNAINEQLESKRWTISYYSKQTRSEYVVEDHIYKIKKLPD
jgi:hypothetical protein